MMDCCCLVWKSIIVQVSRCTGGIFRIFSIPDDKKVFQNKNAKNRRIKGKKAFRNMQVLVGKSSLKLGLIKTKYRAILKKE